jgi:membrane protein DedA with SNARE-associated domain
MTARLLVLLTSAHGFPAYGLVFSVLVACGLGLPLPEDVTLVSGGYLSSLGSVEIAPMILVAFTGILLGDFLIFSAGRRFGAGVVSSRLLSRVVTEEKRCRVEGYFARYGERLVFAARFVPGFRAVTYFVAGASPMAAWKFLLFDGIAACISAPVWIGVGRRFGPHLPSWISFVVLGVAAVVLTLTVLAALRRRKASLVDPSAAFTTAADQVADG